MPKTILTYRLDSGVSSKFYPLSLSYRFFLFLSLSLSTIPKHNPNPPPHSGADFKILCNEYFTDEKSSCWNLLKMSCTFITCLVCMLKINFYIFNIPIRRERPIWKWQVRENEVNTFSLFLKYCTTALLMFLGF